MSDLDLGRFLEQVERAGTLDDVPELPGKSRDDVLAVTERLIDRGWLEAAAENRGDDRLLGARGLRVTAAGASALHDLRRTQRGSDVQGDGSPTPIEQKRRNRLRFMTALYHATDGSRTAFVDMWQLGEQLGWDRQTTDNTVEYLGGEGLLEFVAMGGAIGITHAGVVEVEEAIGDPERPTEHFPPAIHIINVGQMIGSQIAQGNRNMQTINHVAIELLPVIGELVNGVREVLPGISLTPDDEAEMTAELATIDTQLASSRPKKAAIKDALSRAAELLTGAAATGEAALRVGEVVQKIHETLPLV